MSHTHKYIQKRARVTLSLSCQTPTQQQQQKDSTQYCCSCAAVVSELRTSVSKWADSRKEGASWRLDGRLGFGLYGRYCRRMRIWCLSALVRSSTTEQQRSGRVQLSWWRYRARTSEVVKSQADGFKIISWSQHAETIIQNRIKVYPWKKSASSFGDHVHSRSSPQSDTICFSERQLRVEIVDMLACALLNC